MELKIFARSASSTVADYANRQLERSASADRFCRILDGPREHHLGLVKAIDAWDLPAKCHR